ncbi:MAG: sugar ABC transporter substrate-binding protein [Planctomycetota bacterium]|nr:MAG: sugar ABC transporter substrate-binding protein [Planctomycetota bacterium]
MHQPIAMNVGSACGESGRLPLVRWGIAGAALALAAAGLVWRPACQPDAPRAASAPAAAASKAKASQSIQLCQALGPAAPHPIWAVDSTAGCGQGEVTWKARGYVNWQAYAQGEYVGHARTAHVHEYRIRVDDQIAFVFRLTREISSAPYQLQVGDTIRVESLTGDAGAADAAQDNIRRELVIQPDGTITLPLLGQIRAANMTIDGLREHVEQRYLKFYKAPAITVTPVKVNTRLEDLLAAVDARQGSGGLQLQTRVNPDGRLYLPGLGSVCAQGLTIDELKAEVDARYEATIPGVDVTPVLTQRAPRYVFVMGEVNQPGRFTLEGPTTVMGAIGMAGSWKVGANLRQVVVFRRGDDWRLLATMLDVNGALYGRRPAPADEIWLNDCDIVVVPKSPIKVADEFISQFFTQGLYGVFPQFAFGNFNFDNFRSISN